MELSGQSACLEWRKTYVLSVGADLYSQHSDRVETEWRQEDQEFKAISGYIES